MFDTHIHLHKYDNKTLVEKIKIWQEKGIKGVIAVSDDLASSYKTLELHEKFRGFVYPCIGFHPELPIPNERDKEEWKALVKQEREKIVAIGEVGLPHYELQYLGVSIEEALEQLREYIDVAKANQLPLVLHAVHDKATIAVDLLKEENVQHAHFHWLKADTETLNQIVLAGYFISVTLEVCYRKRDERLVNQVPLSQLLVETDGPWQYAEQFQKVETTPLLLRNIVEKIAFIKKAKVEDVVSQLNQNTKNCYLLSCINE